MFRPQRDTPGAPAERPWPASASSPLCWCLRRPPPLLSLWALPTDGLPPHSPTPALGLCCQNRAACAAAHTCQWASVVGPEGDGLEDCLLVSRWSACLPAPLPWICPTSACQSNRLLVFKQFLCIYLFSLRRPACGTLVPRPGIEPAPSAVRAPSPNRWTRGVPQRLFVFIRGQMAPACLLPGRVCPLGL